MKPVAFAYAAPRSLDEVLALLAEHGDDAKVLAGGQSLVPLMNFRLVRPATLIDVNRVAGPRHAMRTAGGSLHLGSLVRTATLERDPAIAAGWPLLREAARLVGHPAIRNRAERSAARPRTRIRRPSYPPHCLHSMRAFTCGSQRAARSVGAAAFFTDFFSTALAPDELLVGIELPASAPRTGGAFLEEARTHGDFAIAGVAVTVTLDAAGHCAHTAIAILGGGATPLRAHEAERSLVGTPADDAAAREAGMLAATACDPPDPADYRRALVAELVRRAVTTARGRAA